MPLKPKCPQKYSRGSTHARNACQFRKKERSAFSVRRGKRSAFSVRREGGLRVTTLRVFDVKEKTTPRNVLSLFPRAKVSHIRVPNAHTHHDPNEGSRVPRLGTLPPRQLLTAFKAAAPAAPGPTDPGHDEACFLSVSRTSPCPANCRCNVTILRAHHQVPKNDGPSHRF